MKLANVFLLFFAGITASLTMAESDAKLKAISERLQPVGSVCIQGESCASEVAVAPSASAESRTGQQIFDKHCAMCHIAGVAGAPKFGDTAAWADRMTKGIDALYASATKGVGAMPPKGLCMDCTDDELKAAVKYTSGAK